MMKRVISLLLSIVMVISMLPVSALATDVQTEDPTTSTEAVMPAEESGLTSGESEPAPPESEPAAPEQTESVAAEDALGSAEEEPQYSTVTEDYVPTVSLPDSDELLDGYLYKLFYEDMAAYGVAAGERLSGVPRHLYDCLKNGIEQIASGEDSVCSTVFTLDASVLEGWGAITSYGYDGSEADMQAKMAAFAAQFDMDTVLDALLHDCSYELYWFDKVTKGAVQMGYSCGYYGNTVEFNSLTVKFQVVEDMRANGYSASSPMVNVSKATKAQDALDKVQEILEIYEGATAYEKVVGFKNEICDLVSYDHDAAENETFSTDADPWQLISVFDGDTTTNVVCEGYSKAFKYLCDLAGVECYAVTGVMAGGNGAGGHMWNIVTLDGANYMVDVTNSDSNTAGQNGSLFLNGYDSGSLAEGYTFNTLALGGTTTFTYDADTLNLWGTDDILVLSAEDYTVPEDGESGGETGGEDGGEIGVGMTETEFYNAVRDAAGVYELTADVTINGELVMDKPVTVAKGATLTVADGGYLGIGKAAWTIEGTLINNGTIDIVAGAEVTIDSGSIHNENNGRLHVGMEDKEIGTLNVEGILGSSGFLCVHLKSTMNIMEGAYVSVLRDDNAAGFLQCNGELNVYGNLDNMSLIVVANTEEDPAVLNVEGVLNNYGSGDFTIDQFGVLTVKGTVQNEGFLLILGNATVTKDGSVIRQGLGELRIDENGKLVNNGKIESDVHAPVAGAFTNNGTFVGTVIGPKGNTQFQAMIDQAIADENDLYVEDAIVLDDTMYIDDEITIYLKQGSSITVPEGKKLIIGKNASIIIWEGAALKLNGTLATEGYYALQLIGGGLIGGGKHTLETAQDHISVVITSGGYVSNNIDTGKMILSATIDNADTLEGIIEAGAGYGNMDLQLDGEVTVDRNITIPQNAMLQLNHSENYLGEIIDVDNLTVAKNYTLTNKGSIIVGNYCTLTNNGTLVNEGSIRVEGNYINNGTEKNSGTIQKIIEIVDTATLIEALDLAAQTATEDNHQDLYVHVGESVVLQSGDHVTIPNHVALHVNGSLTIPSGASMTISPMATLHCSSTLANVKIAKGECLPNYGTLQISMGTFTIEDNFYLGYPNSEVIYSPEATMLGVGRGFATYYDKYASEEELAEILAVAKLGQYNRFRAEISYQAGDAVVVSGSITIPEKTVLEIDFGKTLILESDSVNNGVIRIYGNSLLEIADGATLTNNGEIVMYGAGMMISGNVVGNSPVPGGSGSQETIIVSTYEELEEQLAAEGVKAAQDPEYWGGVIARGEITVPAGKTLTVPARVTLQMNGNLTVPARSGIIVNGTFSLTDQNAVVTISKGATLNNKNYVQVLAGTLDNQGTYTGSGVIEQNEGTRITNIANNKIVFAVEAADMESLKRALEAYSGKGYLELDLYTAPDMSITESVTVPEDTILIMGVYNSQGSIASGAVVTVNGGFGVNYGGIVDVEEGAKLNIIGFAMLQPYSVLNNYGTLNVAAGDGIRNYGTINNYGSLNGSRNIYNIAEPDYGYQGVLIPHEGGLVDGGLGELELALLKNDTYTLTKPLHITQDADLAFGMGKIINITGSGALIVDEGAELTLARVEVYASNGGTVALSDNAALKLTDGAYLEIQDGSLTVAESAQITVDTDMGGMLVISQIDGCTATGIENFRSQMTGLYLIHSEAELLDAVDNRIASDGFGDHMLIINDSFDLTCLVEVPDNVSILLRDDNVLTVKRGGCLALSGLMNIIHGGHLNIEGNVTLVPEGDHGMHFPTGYMNIATTGKITINDGAVMSLSGDAIVNLNRDGVIDVAQGGVLRLNGGAVNMTGGALNTEGMIELMLESGSEISGVDLKKVRVVGCPDSYEELNQMLASNASGTDDTVYGGMILIPLFNITVENSLVIRENTQLILQDTGMGEAVTLLVPTGRTLVNNGTITVSGNAVVHLQKGSFLLGNMPEYENEYNLIDERDRASHDWFVDQLENADGSRLLIDQDVTLVEDVVIPASVGEIIFAAGKLTVPAHVTLTSYARTGFNSDLYIAADGAVQLLNDGTSTYQNEGWLLSYSQYDNDVTIDGSLYIGQGASFCTHNEITVGSTGTVTADGVLSLEAQSQGSIWNINGALNMNGRLHVHINPENDDIFSVLNVNDNGSLNVADTAHVDVAGKMNVSGKVVNHAEFVVASELAELVVAPGAEFNNYGTLVAVLGGLIQVEGELINHARLVLDSTNEIGGKLIVIGKLTNYKRVEAYNSDVVVEGILWNDLVEGQFENGDGILLWNSEMSVFNILTSCNDIYVSGGITSTLTIHPGAALSLIPKGEDYYGALYIEPGSSVNVNGLLANNGLLINHGALWINEDGEFYHGKDGENYGYIHVGMNQGGTMELSSYLFNQGYICVHPEGVLNVHENGVLYNHYVSDSVGGCLDVQGAAHVHAGGLIDNEYLLTVDEAMTIHAGGEVHNFQAKRGSDYGTLRVFKDADFTVNGKLNNEGLFLNFSKKSVVDGGELYVGPTGRMIVNNTFGICNNAVATVDGTLTIGDEDAVRENMALAVDNGAQLTVNGNLINNKNLHVGMAPGQKGNVHVAGNITNNAYFHVHNNGVMLVAAGGVFTNTYGETATGFLQIDGEVAVDGTVNNSFLIGVGADANTVSNDGGQTAVLTIGGNGVLNNKYVNEDLGAISIRPNGQMNLMGQVKNDALLVNSGVIHAQDNGTITAGRKATFTNEGVLVVGAEEEVFHVAIQSEQETLEVSAKKTLKLDALVQPANVTGTKIVWTVSDPILATVKTSGNSVTLTAADVSEPQPLTLTAATADGLAVEDTITVEILPEAKQIKLFECYEVDGVKYEQDLEEYDWWYFNDVYYGFDMDLKAVVAPEGAAADVIWSSSNPDVAYFSDETKGTVTFTGAEGEVTLTATSASNSKVKASVIYRLAAPVELLPKDNAVVDEFGNRLIELVGGQSETLQILDAATGKKLPVEWSIGYFDSYDEWVDGSMYATIASNGKLTAKKVPEAVELIVCGQPVVNEIPVGDEICYYVTIYPATTNIDILDENVAVANGKTLYLDVSDLDGLSLTADIYPADAKNEVTWTSSNNAIATVEDGVIKAGTKTGTVTITATNNDGSKKKATVKVEVGALTTKVTVKGAPETLISKASVTLGYETIPAAPTKSGVTWKIKEGAEIATISSSGKLTAKDVTAPQVIEVVAVSKDAAQIESAPVQIVILPKLEENLNLLNAATSENVTKATLNAETGDVFTISANKFFNADVAGELWNVTWSVKGGNVTLTDADGNALAADKTCSTVKIAVKGSGKATVTATGYTTLNKKVTATVTINAGVLSDGIRLLSDIFMVGSGQSITLKAEAYSNENLKLTNSKLTWSLAPGDEAYAKISSSGKLTAVKDLSNRQEITVIIKAQDGNSELEVPVTITPLAQSIDLWTNVWYDYDPDYDDWYHTTGQNWQWPIYPGEKAQMYADVYPYEDNAVADQTVLWSSSNKSIVDINPVTGEMTYGPKSGSVTITATAQDGSKVKETFKMNVYRPVQEVEIRDGSVVGGKSIKLETLTEFITSDATNKNLTYQITGGDGAAFATISKTQLKTQKVTSVKTVEITPWDAYGNAYEPFEVYIRPATTKVNVVQLDQTEIITELPQNQVLHLGAESLPGYDMPDSDYEEYYTWKISNAKQGGFDIGEEAPVGTVVAPSVDLVGLKPGSTLTVTATATDGSGVKGTMKIKIVDPVIMD